MTLSATVTADTTTGTVSPKTSPNSITTVNTRVSPSGQGSDWKTDTPYTLYTAPSTCKFARIVIPDTGRNPNSSYQTDSFFLESSSSTNYWIGIGIVNDTNNSEDMITLDELGYPRIDLVAVNLYPFEKVAARDPPVSEEELIENIPNFINDLT